MTHRRDSSTCAPANIGFSSVVIRLTSCFCSPITVDRANDDTQLGVLVSGNRADVTYDRNVSPLRTVERIVEWKQQSQAGMKKRDPVGAVVLLIGAFCCRSSRQIAGPDIMTKKKGERGGGLGKKEERRTFRLLCHGY